MAPAAESDLISKLNILEPGYKKKKKGVRYVVEFILKLRALIVKFKQQFKLWRIFGHTTSLSQIEAQPGRSYKEND